MKTFLVRCSEGDFTYEAFERDEAVRMANDKGYFVWSVYQLKDGHRILVGMVD